MAVAQTQAQPEDLRGAVRGRSAQLALMAAARESGELLQRLVPLLAEMMGQDGGIDELRQFVVYVAAATTKAPERWNRFAEAVPKRPVVNDRSCHWYRRGCIQAASAATGLRRWRSDQPVAGDRRNAPQAAGDFVIHGGAFDAHARHRAVA